MGTKFGQTSGEPWKISYPQLEKFTRCFSEADVIGKGVSAKVYKGVRENGEKIAVKMFHADGHPEEQFQHELKILKRLKHPNILPLVGYCHETQYKEMEYQGKKVSAEKIERALCFEYLPKGTLHTHLSEWEDDGLDWHTRYNIIKGVCAGLKYIHENLECPVYHLDIHPDNILLTENMEPQIIDFGISRFIVDKELIQTTETTQGTEGYMPKEYIDSKIISNKHDIFSLGVTIIQTICGIRGYFKKMDMDSKVFIEMIHEHWSNRLKASMYKPLELEVYSDQVKTCIEIAVRCVEEDMEKRPTIRTIVDMLNETETKIHKVLQNKSSSSIDLGSSDWSSTKTVPGLPDSSKYNSTGGSRFKSSTRR